MSTEELARVIHDASCDGGEPAAECRRWSLRKAHRDWYTERAQKISDALEPVIGAANVPVAVRVILEEMW